MKRGQKPQLTAEQRQARAERMRANNADADFVARRKSAAWSDQRRAAKSAELAARNADPLFLARKLAGITRRKGIARCSVPQHHHPVVRGLFAAMRDQRVTRAAIAARVDISEDTLQSWRTRRMPTLDMIDAALNALDLELAIVPAGTRDGNGFHHPKRGRTSL